MKISVIVPSNSLCRIETFVEEFDKLLLFKKMVTLIIVCNGELKTKNVPKRKYIKCIQFNKKIKENDIVPFVELRGVGMKERSADWFLFLDDDHTFDDNADTTLIKSLKFISHHNECGILQLEKQNKEKDGFYIKENAHIWSSRGLFIRNIGFDYNKLSKLKGACEDLLFAYIVLYESYLPYNYYNSGIHRNSPLEKGKYGKRTKEFTDISYQENTLDKNVIGYIRNLYFDYNWKFYGHLQYLEYPNFLKERIKSRLSHMIN